MRAVSAVDCLSRIIFVLPVDICAQTLIVKHHGHRCASPRSLVALLWAEYSPLCTLVDDIVFQYEAAVLTNYLPSCFISLQTATIAFWALHYIFDLRWWFSHSIHSHSSFPMHSYKKRKYKRRPTKPI
uniref:Uncharacterized protein n=1 Tax=uncultured marine group II/III euryarchaeote KM3_07_G11 TaxID=1457840 RepID=A0A075G3T8_9EURY|nr:hypothetical protein [uncultured marine group II/III euryarchaeote KM3_07_G11]